MKNNLTMNTIILLFFNLFLVVGCNNQTKNKNINLEDKALSELEISQQKVTVTDTIQHENMLNVRVLDTIKPKKIVRTINEYKENVNSFSRKKTNNELIKTTDVENITPTTQEEFSFYYSLTYSDGKNQQIHDAITSEILDKAIEDKGSVLFLYLNIAGFVDGEYAEGYHAYIENVTTNNKTKFCAIYKYLSKKSKWILEPLYNEVCKGIKRQEEDY
jgi:hypothetical protein